jgi:RsiW-degrading membrane proteinase PrsW (M82 family)
VAATRFLPVTAPQPPTQKATGTTCSGGGSLGKGVSWWQQTRDLEITMMPDRSPVPQSAQQPRPARAGDLFPLGDWIRHHSLRSWPVLLFLALICVPSIALVILGGNPSASTFDHVAWIFAAYFGVAWLLLLGIIIRPEHVTRTMLLVVVVIALATQVPLAVALETALHGTTSSLGPSIFTVGIPEELAKAIPVLVVAVVYRRRHGLTPRDYLFLGAVSGLAFGAAEVVHYFTVNGIVQFYQTIQASVPAISQLIQSGHSASTSLFAVLIGPVRYFVLDFVWRFITDSITHACWSGLTGYFIGLAATGRHRWLSVSWIGLAMAAVLHGLNDWSRVNGHPVWILVTILSGVLFLGYAKVGSRGDPHAPDGTLPPAWLHGLPVRDAAGPAGQAAHPPAGQPARPPVAQPPLPREPVHHALPGRRPWWDH